MPRHVRITLATAMGTCFGVENAIAMAMRPEHRGRLTIVGQLVHNPQTVERLEEHGIRTVDAAHLDQVDTAHVMITAHGATDALKENLKTKWLVVHDATCPLVMRLHRHARNLEQDGFFPVVIGQAHHVEVRGVVGNLRASAVVASRDDLEQLRGHTRIGVVSQTTNRLSMVEDLVQAIRDLPWVEEVRFIDTICQPVKDRQQAISALLDEDIDLGIVIGGYNSSNTRKLLDLLKDRGIAAHQIERAAELDPAWFETIGHVGITAGTSTPQDVIDQVVARVKEIVQTLPDAS